MKFVQIALAVLLAGTVPAGAQAPVAQAPATQAPATQANAAQPAATPAPQAPTVLAPAPPPPQPPLVLLLDGLGVYVETPYIGVSSLVRPLQQQGFRTRTDSHLMAKTQGVVPDVIIGHSMGGETALRYARKLARAGYPAPLVITVDAAPAPPACGVPRCVNIAGPGFLRVPGAVNLSAWASGARFVAHAQLPTHPAVQRLILQETGAWLAARKTVVARAPAAPKPATPASSTPPPARTAPAQPQMWSVPGWTMPTLAAPVAGKGG